MRNRTAYNKTTSAGTFRRQENKNRNSALVCFWHSLPGSCSLLNQSLVHLNFPSTSLIRNRFSVYVGPELPLLEDSNVGAGSRRARTRPIRRTGCVILFPHLHVLSAEEPTSSDIRISMGSCGTGSGALLSSRVHVLTFRPFCHPRRFSQLNEPTSASGEYW